MSEEIDFRLREALSRLDPGGTDPGYWPRLHRWVVTAAGSELARRRAAQASVSDMLLAWWRALVPGALVAAGFAAGLLFAERSDPSPVAYVDMYEILVAGVEAPEMPYFETTAPDGAIELVNELY